MVFDGWLTMDPENGSTRMRITSFDTLETLRMHRASKLTLNFTSHVLNENISYIDEILMRNKLDVKEVNAKKKMAENPDDVISGCSLRLIIDNKLIQLHDDKFRFLPSDDLVEGIRDMAGVDSVKIAY